MTDVGAGASLRVRPDAGLRALLDPEPLVDVGRDWARWAGPAVSLMVLAMAAYQLRQVDLRQLVAMLPLRPAFWLAFLLYYAAEPLAEWAIYRRLWRLPVEGLAALFRKLVSNTLLLGYLGEVYFYAWARARAHVAAAPFGAIKDVAMLSALAGNLVTLAMVIGAAPLFLSLDLGLEGRTLAASAIVTLGSSCAMMLFRRRLFSLPAAELRFIAATHVARIAATVLLSAALWGMILPSVAIGWWLLLATLRQLVSRLPMVPNKEVVFAGLAMLVVGRGTGLADAVTLIASLVLFANLIVGAALGLAEIARPPEAAA